MASMFGVSRFTPKQQQKFSPITLHHFLRAIRSSQYRIHSNIEVIIRGGGQTLSSPAAPLVETAAVVAAAIAAAIAAAVAVALGTRPSSIRRAWIFVFLGERKQQPPVFLASSMRGATLGACWEEGQERTRKAQQMVPGDPAQSAQVAQARNMLDATWDQGWRKRLKLARGE
ncbi:hypothetical protein F9C07_3223 [Aspergillus flavus]|uniref:Transmembrane protein n=1 Tax=Aspergillus flavus (strain ATCC 200026 / FGSC A1120 / IAM 13836 / NRRL 3357 / JCM 12722 / SRRC 167) TaxID=332952 RepID=A0A7U2R059_ASPFN|nr:hypothetical protein F9C07_3223 [Aspergillus flavus]